MFTKWRWFTCWMPIFAVEDGGGVVDDDPASPGADPEVPADPATPPAEPAGAGVDVATEMARDIRNALGPKTDADPAAVPPKDGTPPAPAAKAEAKPGEPKPGEAKPGEVPPKKEDKYAAPTDMGPKGQTRFKELVGELKSKDAAIEQYESQIGAAREFLKDAENVGVGPQQFNEFFEYMGAVKRGDGAAAMKFLQREMDHLGKEFGIPRGPEDLSLLDRYPDLKDAVDGYKMTKEHAIELAQGRAAKERSERVGQAEAQAAEQADQAKQAEDAGIDEVSKWFSSTAKQDIDFVRKKPLLLEQLPELVQGVPPRLWVAKVKAAYALLGKAAPPAQEKPKPPAPLRPNAGGGQPESTSMFDAIRTGLMEKAGRNG